MRFAQSVGIRCQKDGMDRDVTTCEHEATAAAAATVAMRVSGHRESLKRNAGSDHERDLWLGCTRTP